MKKTKSSERLLKEYISTVVVEDDGGGFGGDYGDVYGAMSDSPYGGGGYGAGSLYKIFVEPFVDVYKVAKAEVSKMAVRTRTALKVGVETLLTTFLPFLGSDYDKIFADQKSQLAQIQKKYQSVFDRIDSALLHNDVVITAFLLNPAVVLGAGLIKKAPDAVMETVEVLLGPNPSASASKYFNELKNSYKAAVRELSAEKQAAGRKTKSLSGGISDSIERRFGSQLNEAEGVKQSPEDILVQGLKNPELVNALKNSEIAKEMRTATKAVIVKTANELAKSVSNIMSVQTLEQLKTKFPSVDISEFGDVPEAELKSVEGPVLKQVKEAAKNLYKKKLEEQIAATAEAGLGEDSQLASIYNKIASRLG